MHLEKIALRSVLRFLFPAVVSIDVPAIPQQRSPYSMQGVLQIAGIPNGAAVAAGGAGAPDALRGTLELAFSWGPLGVNQFLTIQVYKNTDTVDPSFVQNPTNAAAGRTSMLVNPADTDDDVSDNLFGVVTTWLSMLTLNTRWHREGGDLFSQHGPPSPIMYIITPKTWRATAIAGAADCMGPVVIASLLQPAVVRPILYAGFHPGPWLVVGDAFDGYHPPDREEGPIGAPVLPPATETKATKATKATNASQKAP